MLAILTLALLATLRNRLARAAQTQAACTRWRRLPRAAVAPAVDPAPTASPYDSDTAGAAAPSNALQALARREPVSPPGSPPGHAEAPTAAAGAAPSEGSGAGTVQVEEGEGWTVVRGFAAAHDQLETLQALLEYRRGRGREGPAEAQRRTACRGRRIRGGNELSRKVRDTGQRGAQLNPPIRVCGSSFAVPSPHSSLSRLGGAVGGRAVRSSVCMCATATKDRSKGFCKYNESALKRKKTRKSGPCAAVAPLCRERAGPLPR